MALFSSVLTSFSTKVNGQVIDASDVNNPQIDITQIEAIIGVAGANSVVGTFEYDVRSPASNGGGHVQTANKGGTGQTTYTKGDLLIAQSTSVLTKLSVGTDGQALVADSNQTTGIKWGVPALKPTQRVYAAASTIGWLKPANLAYVVVEVQGGGGGGGAGNCGAGGGAGGYSRKVITASTLGASETVVIGVGGPVSSVGGRSSFGTTSYLSGNGGSPGDDSVNATGTGGVGGGSAGGDINSTGGKGANTFWTGALAVNVSQGGSGYFGGGGNQDNSGGYGSGGRPAVAGQVGTVVVWEY